ncbi:uncharacterized protein EI90DRAFT_3052507 [Cantharellus anzutake]|uniref:uncharacterized protein n=1 Tax=Cantharellus anzutake TaxID=1750568 RepID=UPI0019063463|nr:uncharacterized protein EI90DRAFT_3052507 [Cantharellus anzutake]KAF8333593.1 hypothetical protein EI90DRAFT_3052507 [Cantharellus anzutake]
MVDVHIGFAYGLLFLYLDGLFDVFVVNYGLSCVGVIMFVLFVPVQTWLVRWDRKKNGGKIRPESLYGAFPFHCSGLHGPQRLVWDTPRTGALSWPQVGHPAFFNPRALSLRPSFLGAAGCTHLGVYLFQRLRTQVAVSILAAISFGVVILICMWVTG